MMQLESVVHVEKLWRTEESRSLNRQHPEGFPTLPEIPTGRYTSEEFFLLEKKYLWPKTWLFVGLADEVPTAGCFRSYTINDVPVLVVRGKDQKIRAFYNVCQHRGATLTQKPEGKTNNLTCRYHCWSYGLDGSLTFVPDEHDFPNLDRARKSLHPLRCEMHGNLIFINFDLAADPLIEYLGALGHVLSDVPLDKVRLYKTLTYDVACNWKCIHDAFSETYHVKYVHTNSVNLAIDSKYTARFMYPNGHNGMIVKAQSGPETGMVNVFDRTSGNEAAPPAASGLKEVTRMGQRSYNVFPHLTIPIAENLFPILSPWPVSVGRTRLEVRFLKIPAADGSFDTEADRATVEFFDAITREDISALADMQGSLSSGGIASMPLCYGEQFICNYHQEIDRVIGRSRVPAELRIEEVTLPLVGKSQLG